MIKYFVFCFVFFIFNESAYSGFFNSFFNSSSCVSAFLLLCGLGALFLRPASSCACSYAFLHGVDSKAYLAAALWCCSFVRLWLWAWVPVVAPTFHSFPFSFHAGYISLFILSYCPLGLWVLISIVRVFLYFCNHAIYSPAGLWSCAVLFPWGFG